MAKMPKVSLDLMKSIGEQLKMGVQEIDDEHIRYTYLSEMERQLHKENPVLAAFASESFDAMEAYIDNEDHLAAANMIGRTVYLVLYNAIKQQMICDELKNG